MFNSENPTHYYLLDSVYLRPKRGEGVVRAKNEGHLRTNSVLLKTLYKLFVRPSYDF